jgi:hypothetical protein
MGRGASCKYETTFLWINVRIGINDEFGVERNDTAMVGPNARMGLQLDIETLLNLKGVSVGFLKD